MRPLPTTGRFALVLAFVVLAGALPAGQAVDQPPDDWDAIAAAPQGARVKLTLTDGKWVAGRIADFETEAVVLTDLEMDPRGITIPTNSVSGNRYRFLRTSVARAHLFTKITPPLPAAESLHELRVLVRSGDRIKLTTSDGENVAGTVTSLSASSISMRTGAQVRQFSADDISAIRQRRPDSAKEGALVGLAIGAGAGFMGGCGACHLQIPLITGAIGAGIGAGIDALVNTEMVVFRGRGNSVKRVTVVPQLAKSHKSVQVAVRF